MTSKDQTAKNVPAPRLRFPGFVGEWEEKKLGDVAKGVKAKATPEDSQDVLTLSGEFGLIKQGDYFGKKIAGENTERYIRIIKDDFVYNDRVTKSSEYGTIKRLDRYNSGIVSPIYKCFRFNERENKTFWQYYFESGIHDSELQGFANEGARAGRFNISTEKFLTTRVARPDPAEQTHIAAALSSLDAVIAAHQDRLDALRGHKRGLMQQLFPQEGERVPRLRFPEFEGAGEWEVSTVGQNTLKVGSGITPSGGDSNYKSSGRPFVRSQNVGWGELITDDMAYIDEDVHATFPATELKLSDILLNITGASIGRAALANERVAGGNVNQHVCIIRANTQNLVPTYLLQFLLSENGQAQIDSFQAGGNRQGLNFAQIRSFKLPLPSLPEQTRIASFLSSLDDLMTAQADKLAALREFKRGLMQGLFPSTGASEGQ